MARGLPINGISHPDYDVFHSLLLLTAPPYIITRPLSYLTYYMYPLWNDYLLLLKVYTPRRHLLHYTNTIRHPHTPGIALSQRHLLLDYTIHICTNNQLHHDNKNNTKHHVTRKRLLSYIHTQSLHPHAHTHTHTHTQTHLHISRHAGLTVAAFSSGLIFTRYCITQLAYMYYTAPSDLSRTSIYTSRTSLHSKSSKKSFN